MIVASWTHGSKTHNIRLGPRSLPTVRVAVHAVWMEASMARSHNQTLRCPSPGNDDVARIWQICGRSASSMYEVLGTALSRSGPHHTHPACKATCCGLSHRPPLCQNARALESIAPPPAHRCVDSSGPLGRQRRIGLAIRRARPL